MKKEKVVLAYSGGLDTSVCIRWLSEAGYRVIAFCADLGQGESLGPPFRGDGPRWSLPSAATGGGDGQALGPVRERGLRCGAEKVVVKDLREPFVQGYILPALRAGAVYEGKYLLATALSRPLIAKALSEVAAEERAPAVAHGCTGKGNDQVRIEVSLRILNPKLQVIAPVREWKLRSRQDEVEYARRRKIPIPQKKDSRYSLDQNLWGISIESGPLEDPWVEPPQEAFRWTKDPARAPARPRTVQIEFRKGAPVGLDGRALGLQETIRRLNRLGGEHGVGRSDLIEDRLVGIKSREVYEAPAATILHAAHRELEHLTLDREMLAFKESVSQRYARLIYDGLWFTPLRQALDAFVRETQARVTGAVKVKLFKGACIPVGRRSPHSLYARALATYEGKDDFDRQAAGGFITLWGLPYVGHSRESGNPTQAGSSPSRG